MGQPSDIKDLVIFIPTAEVDSHQLLEYLMHHELGHAIEKYGPTPKGEYAATLHGLKGGKTFEGVKNAYDIVRYLREFEKRGKLEGDMRVTLDFLANTRGLEAFPNETARNESIRNLNLLGQKVHLISKEENKLLPSLTIYPTDPRYASPLQIWLMSDALSKVPMGRAYEVIGK